MTDDNSRPDHSNPEASSQPEGTPNPTITNATGAAPQPAESAAETTPLEPATPQASDSQALTVPVPSPELVQPPTVVQPPAAPEQYQRPHYQPAPRYGAYLPQQPGPQQPAQQPVLHQPTQQYPVGPGVQQQAAQPGQPPYGQGPTGPLTPLGLPADNGQRRRDKSGKRIGAGFLVAALAIGTVLGGAAGAGVALVWSGSQPDPVSNSTESAGTSITVNDPDNATQTTAIAAVAMPSVVTIEVQGSSAAGSGSGVILSEDGYVLTNAHVATLAGADANPSIEVEASNGKLYKASIVGTDPLADLAVLKLEGASGLTPIEFADSSALNVGDRTVAIGAPLGLANTVTTGIVSSLNRSISIASSEVPEDTEQPEQTTPDDDFWNFDLPDDSGQSQQQQSSGSGTVFLSAIQTDAAINPGNSGGALVDSEGKLIGINVAIASATGSQDTAGSIGVGFAIPSNLAKRVSDEIIATGSAQHGQLGLQVIDSDATDDAGVSVLGATVSEVVAGSGAEEAGFQAGDVVTSFDGVPVQDTIDLFAVVRAAAPGQDVVVGYLRDGKAAEATVTLKVFES